MRLGLVFLLAALLAGPAVADRDADDRRQMISESIASYSGSCPCPNYTDRAGRRCGARSAWSRPGGQAPKCYPDDISDAELAAWRARKGRGG